MHRADFRFRVGADAPAIARGGVRIFVGAVVVGELSLSVRVGERPEPRPLRTSARRFRKVFASYSHADTEVVEAVASAVQLLGDEYLIDSHDLRSGEDWQQRIGELIDDADVFQLFWSSNALQSHYVLAECRHALALRREGFIRPVYWQDPFPEDPSQDLPPTSDPPAPLLPPGRAQHGGARSSGGRAPAAGRRRAAARAPPVAAAARRHRRRPAEHAGPPPSSRPRSTPGHVGRGRRGRGPRGRASAAAPSRPEGTERHRVVSGDHAGRIHRHGRRRGAARPPSPRPGTGADRPDRCRAATTRRSTAPSPTSAAWRSPRTRAAG